MADQLIRGFAYFPEKNIDEIREGSRDFSIEGLETRYFDGLTRYGNYIEAPGVFLSGRVPTDYSSEEILYLLRKTAGLNEETKDCDISAESEDRMSHILRGEPSGNYLGLLVSPYFVFREAEEAASVFGRLEKAHDILLREVKYNQESMICIDLLLEEDHLVINALNSAGRFGAFDNLYTYLNLM